MTLRLVHELAGTAAHPLDRPGLLHELDGPCQAGGIRRLRREELDKLVRALLGKVADRPHGGHSALALGDVAPEVLALRLGVADEVEQVVLELEGEAGGHAEGAQGLDLPLACAGADRAHDERDRGGVVGRLVGRHVQVVVHGDVPAAVADPAQVERLALEGAALHPHQLVDEPQAHVRAQRLVVEDGLGRHDEGKVAHVGSDADAVAHVQARHAAPELALVGDVVVDERGALERLDRDGGGKRALGAAAHGLGSE